MSWIAWIFAVLAALLGWRLAVGPQLEPALFEYGGPLPQLVPNHRLGAAEHLFEGQVHGPEGFAVDKNGLIYTSLGDGRIIRFKPEAKKFEEFARTGSNLTLCNGSPSTQPICGRPLAMKFDSEGNLIVADGYKGILSVDPQGRVTPLVVEAEKVPLVYADGLDIAPDGMVYFTEMSTRYPMMHQFTGLLDGDSSGRVLSYNPKTRETKVLLKDLPYANGLTLSHDGRSLVISLSLTCAVMRYDLATGKTSTLVRNLPGVPDNVLKHPHRPTYLVTLDFKRAQPFDLVTELASRPMARKILARLIPSIVLLLLTPSYGIVLEVDENGNIVTSYQDPTGRTGWLTEARVIGEYLYLGSWLNHFAARVPLSALEQ